MENKKEITPKELKNRWDFKKTQIQSLANNIQSLRLNLTKDLKSENEKVFLTALVISMMDRTAERVGNDESANNGHYGMTGMEKKHIKVNGDTIHLKYIGKSGVEHEKEFTDSKLANALKRAISNSPNHDVFTTSSGFKINAAKVNRYLKDFNVRAKDLRGYSANKWVIEKLKSCDIDKEEKNRKKRFNEVLKSVSEKIGHGKATLRKHYLIPELEQNYIEMGKIIDVSNKESYEEGGSVTHDGTKGGWLKGKRHYAKDGTPLGGIPAVVGNSEKPVELEGGEVIINREASKKHWKELSKINQSAGGGVPIGPPETDYDDYKDGGTVIDFNPNRLPNKRIYDFAKRVKDNYPKVWDLGGNIFGNEAFKNLERALKRGYWTENEKWMYVKWRAYVARHKGDFRIAGVIAMLKWVDKVDKGFPYMKNLIEEEIEKRYPKKEKGGAITYKEKYNKKYGYNKSESHDLDEISEDTGVSEKGLQQIYNKGIGAYKTNPESVRPNVKSKEQWAMGRVYSAVMGGKAARVDANELKMENGGLTESKPKIIYPNTNSAYDKQAQKFIIDFLKRKKLKDLIKYADKNKNYETYIVYDKNYPSESKVYVTDSIEKAYNASLNLDVMELNIVKAKKDFNFIIYDYYNGDLFGGYNGKLYDEKGYLKKDVKDLAIQNIRNYFDKFSSIAKTKEMENGGSTSWDKLASASSRFRPYETIVFEPPLIGLNGAKLTAYTWAYEMTMLPNYEGELVGKRVSDWSQAEMSAETGRGIVHKYTIELPNGEVKTVSSESVPILLGYQDRTQAKVFGNLATASKTLAKQQMKLAILESKYKEYKDAVQSIKDKGFPEPKVEKSESLSRYKLFVGDGSCYINDDGTYDQERLDCAKDNYVKNRLIEMGIDVYGANRSSAIYDLKNRVERQKHKVENMLNPKMENGGELDDFDWESLYNPSPEEEKRRDDELQKSKEKEKEDWYQGTKFSKKWAATYKDAVNRTVKDYLDAKATYDDWASRQYKSNKGMVYLGGDDIFGEAKSIGSINEGRRQRVLRGAKMQMDESIETLKELQLSQEEIDNLISSKMEHGGITESHEDLESQIMKQQFGR